MTDQLSFNEMPSKVLVSIVIPVLNESVSIENCLRPLQHLRCQGYQIIAADGGSDDDSVDLLTPLVDTVISCRPGRANQMNAGAAQAVGEWLLFLHADTYLPDTSQIKAVLSETTRLWGFFPVRLSGSHFMFRIIERAISWRSRLSSVATGDQCIFIRRDIFSQVGGFPNVVLMEDVAMSKCLRKNSSPLCWPEPVKTSSRRWEQYGIFKTVILMWRLRFLYFLGVRPEKLQQLYR